jgi:hypothetical protein
MIDTVCLLIPRDKMTIMGNAQDGAASWNLHSKTEQYEKFVKNPSKRNIDSGSYFPRLTGYNRKGFGKDFNIRVEFSAPKLLFFNNLDELEENDFPKVIATLQQRLHEMGVLVAKSVLEKAAVSSVHFSKNIRLVDGYTATHLISEMNKVDLRKSFDFTRARYVNDGQSLYAHTTAHQLIIYDKIADLNKDKKRAIDKDQTLQQFNLFSGLEAAEEMVEVIRFEIRLNHKQKMNKVLQQLGYNKNPTFKDVFNATLSQRVVSDYWHRLIKDRNLGLFSVSLSLKDMLRIVHIADKSIKPKKAIYLIGLFMLGKDESGMRELRSIITKKAHDRTWYRITKDMQIATDLIAKNNLRDWVHQIDKSLAEFQAYKHIPKTPRGYGV